MLAGSLLIAVPLACASSTDEEIAKLLAGRVALGVILSDKDAIAFGVSDFDPNTILGTEIDGLGDDTTIEARRNKKAYVFPYTHNIQVHDQNSAHSFGATGYFLESKSQFTIDTESNIDDQFNEKNYGVALGYEYKKMLTERMSLSAGIQMHMMRYENQFVANNLISQIFEEIYTGPFLNTSAWSAIFVPQVKLEYIKPQSWGRLELSSKLNYFDGLTWGDANIGDPEGYYMINQAFAYYDIKEQSQTLFTGVKRVDVSDAIQQGLSTSYYYELSLGWLYNKPSRIEWIENVGLGLNFNYGSSLRGGSIMLYFNK